MPWLKNYLAAPTPNETRTHNSLKAPVRVAANSTALVQCAGDGTIVLFGQRGAVYSGTHSLIHFSAIKSSEINGSLSMISVAS